MNSFDISSNLLCIFQSILQPTKLEENELDDAISVFRNHCEPHPMSIPMSNMDGSSYVGPSPLVNTLGN